MTRKKIEAFPVYNYECEKCGEILEVMDGDFEWNPDEGCDTAERSCFVCDKEYLVTR